MQNKKINIIVSLLLAFCILFANIAPSFAAFMDEDNETTKKERQVLKKIDIIKETFPKQIDKEALYATLVHRGNYTDYVNASYDPNWDEENFKNQWGNFNNDVDEVTSAPWFSIIDISALAALLGGALDCLIVEEDEDAEEEKLDPECVFNKAVEQRIKNPTHESEENVTVHSFGMQSIDLLTAATIVMLDSSGWIGTYSDENYQKALAGEGLVGNLAEGYIPRFAATVFNGLFCTVGALADIGTNGWAVDMATSKFNPTASFTDYAEFGSSALFSTFEDRLSRYYTMTKICSNGFIGGTYQSVQNMSDKDQYQRRKDKIAKEIITLAQAFRGGNSSDNCIVNPSASGAFSTWKQADPEWGDFIIGSSIEDTMTNIGCLVTSMAIQIARSGTAITGVSQFNPGTFAKIVKENGGLNDSGAFSFESKYWESVASNFKNGDFKSVNISDTSTLAQTLSEELSTAQDEKYQKFIVLRIHHNSSDQHWVAVNAVSDNEVTIMDPGGPTGNTLDENYEGWVVDGYQVLYATDVLFGQTGTSTGGSSADYCEVGQIIIPEEFGNGGYSVTFYHNNDNSWSWDRNSNQGKLYYDYWIPSGAQYDNGIAVLDGRYLIACTSTFGNVGDKIDFFLDDGTKIPCIIADIKNPSDAGYNEWGHNNGQNIIEFEVSRDYYNKYGNPGNENWFSEWGGKRVSSATNLGSIWL